MKIYNDIGEMLKILKPVSDHLELAVLNDEFDISRESLFGAAYTINEAIEGIVEFEKRNRRQMEKNARGVDGPTRKGSMRGSFRNEKIRPGADPFRRSRPHQMKQNLKDIDWPYAGKLEALGC